MRLTSEDRARIAEKSKSILERLKDGPKKVASVGPVSEKKANARLKEWRDLVARGDEALFQKRLALDGLDLDGVRPLLGGPGGGDGSPPPAWTERLNDILLSVGEYPFEKLAVRPSADCAFRDPVRPQPFEELFVPIVLMARRRLMEEAGALSALLSDEAARSLERLLLIRLTEISGRVLEVEFNTYLACLQFAGASYAEVARDADSRRHYLGFVKTLYDGGLADLFKEYAVLARRIALRIDQWIELSLEFLKRLRDDLPEIQKAFKLSDPGKVVRAEPGLSDSHGGGRAVMVLTFASGFKLVYKPKDLGLEAGYFRFVEHLNGLGLPLDFKILRVIERGGYGWVEFVAQTPVDNEEQARRYFRRAGMLLGLIYVFDGIDFHSENVIACGEHPVPIDLETFFHHRVDYPEDVKALTSAAKEIIADSVLRTHFLPQLYKTRDKFMDFTGMGGMPGQEEAVEVLKWKNLNTDAMGYKVARERPSSSAAANALRMGDGYLSPEDYADEIVGGFEGIYQFLIDNRDSFLLPGSLFSALFRHKSRFVFRDTALYAAILKKTAHPDYQREGVDLSIQLDIVSRPFVTLEEKSALWPMVADEAAALWNLDVPKFTVSGSSDAMEFENGARSPKAFVDSPLEVVGRKLRGLGERDRDWQVGLIEGSLQAREFRGTKVSIPGKPVPRDAAAIAPLGKEGLILHASMLAAEMRAKAVRSFAGEPSWIILKGIPNSDRFMLADMTFSLYDGYPGVALFLAALEKADPGSGHGEAARSCMALMLRWLKKAAPSDVEEAGIGGCCGLGSMVYSLTRLGGLLGGSELSAAAEFAASLFSRKIIDDDKSFDVLGGSAGAILGLLALYKATGNRAALDHAVYCGAHLLKKRVAGPSGFRVWKCVEDSPPLTGFSHGAAGISYALLKLYQETREPELLLAAQESHAFEAAVFDANERNWPDFRTAKDAEAKGTAPGFMSAWCHGAAGIALGRLGALGILDSEDIRRDIRTALETAKSLAFQPKDHLCCGNAGRAEIMLTAGMKMPDSKWAQEALQLTSRIVDRAKRNGGFEPSFLFDRYDPTFFQGSAGLGYHLLRLAEPERLPSILLLE